MFVTIVLQLVLAVGTVALVIVLLPAVVGLCALYHAGRWGRLYFQILAQVLGLTAGTAQPPPTGQHRHGGEPAYRHYLFGPGRSDLSVLLSRLRTELPADFQATSARIWAVWMIGPLRVEAAVARLIGLIFTYSLVLGTLIAGLVLVLVTVVQIVLGTVLLGVAFAVVFLLRAVDAGLLRVRRIRISCPRCYRAIGYPAYRCPTCAALHRDVRPGPYGVLRRRCRCDQQWLPTLLLLGSHRLTAWCPYPDCGVQLADRSGTATETMVAVLGASNAGKTRLLTVLMLALLNRTGETSVQFADELTGRRLRQLEPALGAGEATRRTLMELPRAYSFYVGPERGTRRLVHLFDPAGERFYDSERLEELQYLRTVNSYLFVIDPLSLGQIWAELEPSLRERYDPLRAERAPEFVFQQVLQNIEAMGVNPEQARLAVVISKADLLTHAGIPTPPPDSASIERWLDDLGMDNLVRSVRHSFGEVCFFVTAAVSSDDGAATGVADLLGWVLAGRR
jgi:double-GTPase-like protein